MIPNLNDLAAWRGGEGREELARVSGGLVCARAGPPSARPNSELAAARGLGTPAL